MKTATVTWVTYNNYGTLLQAYALQKALEQLGHENVILSDREILKALRESRPPKTKAQKPAAMPESQSARMKRLLADPGRLYRSMLARKDPERYGMPYEASQTACETFRQQALNLREDVTGDSLAGLNGAYDAFLCGSDQIWSLFEENFHPYYFLDFAQKKKIAYAPSLGTHQISPERAQQLKLLLKDFSALSVRESVSAGQLTEITGKQVQWVADPTLLHDREFWSDFASEIPVRKKNYLLCYFLEHKAWYFDYARRLAGKLGLKLLLIPNKWDHLQHSFVLDAPVGPREFVSLFRDAAYVLTDSYHGSIFSLIFQKDFQYLQRFAENDPKSQNIRVDSLFGYLGLTDTVIRREKDSLSGPVLNYADIHSKINALRCCSKRYLAEAVMQEYTNDRQNSK